MGVHPGEVGLIVGTPRRADLDNPVPLRTLEQLQERIGIAFKNPSLLQEALTHSSFANESPHISPRDNERLEYLGDAVLQLITADYLFKLRPGAHEGEMTQVRSAMVNTNTLALLGENLGLGSFLYLGKGIAKGGGRSLKSLLANAFEAVLGAIFLDAGFDAAYHHYLAQFRALPEPLQDENHKGRLQRVVQDLYNRAPVYDSVGAGVGRRREYTAVVYAGSEPLGTGHGSTKQAAEQEAALAALARLEGAEGQGLPGASAFASPAASPLSAGNGLPVLRRRSRGGRRQTDLTAAADQQAGLAASVSAGPVAREAAQPVPGEPPFLEAGGEGASAQTEHPVPGEPPFVTKAAEPRGSRPGRRPTAGGGRGRAGRPGAGPGVQAKPALPATEQLVGPPAGTQSGGPSVSPVSAPAAVEQPAAQVGGAASPRRSRGRRRRGSSEPPAGSKEAGPGDGSATAGVRATVSVAAPVRQEPAPTGQDLRDSGAGDLPFGVPTDAPNPRGGQAAAGQPGVATAGSQTPAATQRGAAKSPAPDPAAAAPPRSSGPVRRRPPRPRRPPSVPTDTSRSGSAQS